MLSLHLSSLALLRKSQGEAGEGVASNLDTETQQVADFIKCPVFGDGARHCGAERLRGQLSTNKPCLFLLLGLHQVVFSSWHACLLFLAY